MGDLRGDGLGLQRGRGSCVEPGALSSSLAYAPTSHWFSLRVDSISVYINADIDRALDEIHVGITEASDGADTW